MDESQRIWSDVHLVFEAHRKTGDVDAHTAFERVAQKCLRLSTRQSFDATNCLVREEDLDINDLNQLIVHHLRDTPKRDGGNLVIIEDGARRVVIDGNNRVNRWRKVGISGTVRAIIVEPIASN